MKCEKCGKYNWNDSKVCEFCGNTLTNLSNKDDSRKRNRIIILGVILFVFIILSIYSVKLVVYLLITILAVAILWGFPLWLLVIHPKRKSQKQEKKEKDFLLSNDADFVLKDIQYFDGVENFIKSNNCNIFIQKDKIKIVNLNNNNIAYIKYSQITACDIFNDQQIQEQTINQNGSVIGRGLLGGYLFGPVGLFLGGISGVGAKNKNVIHTINNYYIIINYISKDTNEKKAISFCSPIVTSDMNKLVELINDKLSNKEVEL